MLRGHLKVRTVRLRNFRPPPPVRAHTLLAYTPSTSVLIVFFKEDMTEMYFTNYYQSENHRQRYKIKKLLYKAIGKCLIKTPKKLLGSSLRFLTIQRRW